mmetsp:Transcript_38196/g.61839  ORF Transcript_38196/g.61839 Transcript_38196/m.61839 type:complete len:113 (-) Transcript_38196:1411-1749(-)
MRQVISARCAVQSTIQRAGSRAVVGPRLAAPSERDPAFASAQLALLSSDGGKEGFDQRPPSLSHDRMLRPSVPPPPSSLLSPPFLLHLTYNLTSTWASCGKKIFRRKGRRDL